MEPPAERVPEDSSPIDMYKPLLRQIPKLDRDVYLVSRRTMTQHHHCFAAQARAGIPPALPRTCQYLCMPNKVLS